MVVSTKRHTITTTHHHHVLVWSSVGLLDARLEDLLELRALEGAVLDIIALLKPSKQHVHKEHHPSNHPGRASYHYAVLLEVLSLAQDLGFDRIHRRETLRYKMLASAKLKTLFPPLFRARPSYVRCTCLARYHGLSRSGSRGRMR